MDIQQIVLELIDAGWTQKAIADRLGCSQPTISDIAHGRVGKKRPAYKIVVGLENLHAEVFGQTSVSPPRLRPRPDAARDSEGAEASSYGAALMGGGA
ncbi:hypothetical protein PanNE5_03320 [Pandoraea sp. NE5]|uniref:helix-turn-helix domain-containing protein n=1 Tax=Pandoraea sp. NE5 TaxID=2904129 RepID=UPI00220C7543|nr:hypothetical protein PanNE5_03320 [Pandoraea sp. NE5]